MRTLLQLLDGMRQVVRQFPSHFEYKEEALAFLAQMEFRTLAKRVAEQFKVEPPVIDDTPGNAGGWVPPSS